MVPLETYYFQPGDPSMVEFAYLTELAVPISVGYSYLAGGMGTAEVGLDYCDSHNCLRPASARPSVISSA